MSAGETVADAKARLMGDRTAAALEEQRAHHEKQLEERDKRITELTEHNRKGSDELGHKVDECEMLRRQLEHETIRAERLNAELRITQERAEVEARALTLNIKLLSGELLRLQEEDPQPPTTQEESSS